MRIYSPNEAAQLFKTIESQIVTLASTIDQFVAGEPSYSKDRANWEKYKEGLPTITTGLEKFNRKIADLKYDAYEAARKEIK